MNSLSVPLQGQKHSLSLCTLELEDDLEETHEGVDGIGNLFYLWELTDRVFEKGLLLVHPLNQILGIR